jgi:WD40 repeat protein
VALSADGKKLAAGSDSAIVVWNLDTGTTRFTLRMDAPVSQAVFAADSKTLAAISSRGLGQLWDATTGEDRGSFGRAGSTYPRFALSPDGAIVATSSADGSLQLWNAADGSVKLSLAGHQGLVPCLGFSPDGKLLASGGRFEKAIKLWELSTGRELATLTGHKERVYSVTFAPDGKSFVAADFNGSMKYWNAAEQRVNTELERVQIGDELRGTPRGQWAVSDSLKFWAATSGNDVWWLDISDFTTP